MRSPARDVCRLVRAGQARGDGCGWLCEQPHRLECSAITARVVGKTPRPLWKQSIDAEGRVKGRVGPQQPPHSPSTAPPPRAPGALGHCGGGAELGLPMAEPWADLWLCPLGRWRTREWTAAAPWLVGPGPLWALWAHLGAGPGPSCSPLPRQAWVHSYRLKRACTGGAVNTAPRAAYLHPRRGRGPNRPAPGQGHENVRSERGLKEAFRCLKVSLKRTPTRLPADSSPETLQVSREWPGKFRVLRGKALPPRILCPEGLLLNTEGKGISLT